MLNYKVSTNILQLGIKLQTSNYCFQDMLTYNGINYSLIIQHKMYYVYLHHLPFNVFLTLTPYVCCLFPIYFSS